MPTAPKNRLSPSAAIVNRLGFSDGAIRKAVISTSLNHPLTIFPTTLGLLGSFWIGVMGPSLPAVLAAIGSFSTGMASFIVNYFFRWDGHANGYLDNLAKEMIDYRQWSKSEIKRILMECESIGGVGKYAAKGHQQYNKINGKFDLLQDLLANKLDRQELAYARFLGSAEQVYLNTLDNLRDLANYIKSIASIGSDYKADLARLQQLKNLSPSEQQELATLIERDKLRQDQQRKINELLSLNEQALTKIDVTIAAFTSTRTRKQQAVVDIETAIEELEELAAQVHQYSVSV